MKKLYSFFLLTALLAVSQLRAADRIVGGDLSLVPAYEQAGDQWLDENGKIIPDLIAYVKQKGWNAVRVRIFVDPSQESDPSVCQDFNYALALGKRVKAAGLNLLLDFHYSDTWSDPGTQRIPASWTDHTDAALATQIYNYTQQTIKGFIEGDATPDYVQIGNEITYGLLWNNADGKYPTKATEYATVGYCPTWSSKYSDGTAQWKRTASFLNNAAHAVRKAFDEQRKDSTQVKIVVHTTMGPNHSDNFFKHLRTAGFTNYDIVGLSYYPFINGKLEALGTLLNTMRKDFPEKPVHIVETSWYNGYYPYTVDAEGEYTIASLNANWTANAQGQVNYLNDLSAYLKKYDNVSGLYYWQPEECGTGYGKPVMNGWMNRGLWKNGSGKQHTILKTSDGSTGITALARYASDEAVPEYEDASQYFTNLGFETGDLSGWNIEQAWATQKASNISSWASTDVIEGTYSLELWNSTMADGAIISQVTTLPEGRYLVTVKARANKKGFYLYANGAKTAIAAETPTVWSAKTDAKRGVLEIGLGCKESQDDNYIYADAFTVTRIGDATDEPDIDDTQGDDEPVENEFSDDQGLVYTLNPENLTASVKNGKASITEVVVPSVIEVEGTSYRVRSIDKSAFSGNAFLNSLTIGKGITSIWGSAFSDCWSLTKLTFEEGSELTTIDGWAFYNCNIDSLDIPAGVTNIAEGAFSKCWNLNYVALRGEVAKIGDFAFSVWSNSDTIYAERSFSPLKYGVWIYATDVPEISPKAFSPDDVAEATLYVHYRLVDSEAYRSLGFKDVQPLDEFNGSLSYTDAQGVKYLAWPATGVATVVGYNAAHAPSVVSDWQIEIPEFVLVDDFEYEVDSIAPHAFDNHWTLSAVTLPETICSIGEWAFCNTAISSVVLGEYVEAIPVGAFSKCWNLATVECKGELASIGDFAFSAWAEEGCASSGNTLKSLTLWNTAVPEISERAFHADDIAKGCLYVPESLVSNATYNALGFAHVYPIGFDGIRGIDEMLNGQMVNGKWSNGKCYDLSGRPVRAFRRGVYIMNGRKIVR